MRKPEGCRAWETQGKFSMKESELQNHVRQSLALLGYTIIEIGKTRAKVRCNKCGSYSHATGWQGNTVGAPDIYIHAPWWASCAVGIELKTTKGAVRKQQQNLADQGMTSICRSVTEVLTIVALFEDNLNHNAQAEKVRKFLEVNKHVCF